MDRYDRLQNTNLFSKEYVNGFWSEMDPNIQAILKNIENKENWTYSYKEYPELYEQLNQFLQDFKNNKENTDIYSSETTHVLVRFLVSLPISYSIIAMSYMDQNMPELLHFLLLTIYNELIDEQSDNFPYYKNLHQRIEMVVHSKVTLSLFTNIIDTMDIIESN